MWTSAAHITRGNLPHPRPLSFKRRGVAEGRGEVFSDPPLAPPRRGIRRNIYYVVIPGFFLSFPRRRESRSPAWRNFALSGFGLNLERARLHVDSRTPALAGVTLMWCRVTPPDTPHPSDLQFIHLTFNFTAQVSPTPKFQAHFPLDK